MSTNRTHHHRCRLLFLLICCLTVCLLPAKAINNNGFAQNPERVYESSAPDVHFWTNAEGVPQLDYRVLAPFDSTSGTTNFPKYVNFYGGGINNGDWRGVIMRAFDTVHFMNTGSITDDKRILPPLFDQERAQMLRDDSLASSGNSAICTIELETSGILWGPLWTKPPRQFDFKTERKLFHRQFNGQDCLLGPVRISAYYIRFDGPISAIGSDVELNAQRIVVNGVDLPPAHWREALAQRVIQAKASQPSANHTSK